MTGNWPVWSEYDFDMSDRGTILYSMSPVLTLSGTWGGDKSMSMGSCVGAEDGALVDCRLVCSWSRWPFADASLWGRCLERSLVVNPGQVERKPFRNAWRIVDGRGLKRAPA